MSLKEMAPRYQVGDRVSIDKSVTTMPALPAYVGVVQNVVPSYVDKTVGYNLALDGDPRPGRLWFFLQNQLTPA
ncbi:MAG: hypothetical protein IPP13_27895 [Kouleothrix sp.]|jgi:hypothetical protein|nr:hypothetical protein [Kouleothrix sp.]